MLEELAGYFEGWVWEEGDRCFIELMRARHSNPLDVVAVLPEDVVEIEEDEPEEYPEESSVRVLTNALVKLAEDANHRASVSQDRYLQAIDSMVDASIEMAHAQAQLAADKDEEEPAWIKALTAISPAFGPLVGDLAKKAADKKDETKALEEGEPKTEEEPVESDHPPIMPTERVQNPLDARG